MEMDEAQLKTAAAKVQARGDEEEGEGEGGDRSFPSGLELSNVSEIQEKITMIKAEEMLVEWKKINMEAEVRFANKAKVLEHTETMKEELFVKFGEDVDDIFEAFQFYKLNVDITDDDRIRYKKNAA
jgi:hypothetical protein